MGTEIPLRLQRAADGGLEDVAFTFTYQPLRDTCGAVEGILVLAVDVTTQVQARLRAEELARQLRAERDRLQQVLDALPAGVVRADVSGRFTMSNMAAEVMYGPNLMRQVVPRAEQEAYEAYGACRLDGTPYPSADLPLQRSLWRGEVVRGEQNAGTYQDVPGFCKSATVEEIRAHGYVLTPGRYVGAEAAVDDGEPFAQKMARLVATLEEQFAESARLEAAIRENLRGLGYDA